jgi:uncharacterized protein
LLRRRYIITYSRYKLLFLVSLTEGIALLVALFLANFFKIDILPLTKNFFRDITIGTFGALLPLALFIFLLSERTENIPLLGSLRKLITAEIKPLLSQITVLDICLISLFAGFAEELLFRGVIQIKLGIVAASIIFGLLHAANLSYCIFATILGFYIGTLFHIYQSILIPIQLHFFYDLGALIYLRYFVKTPNP